MPTLTSSGTFTIGDTSMGSTSTGTTVLPPIGYGTGGTGRLVHPTLGVFDYLYKPDQWAGFDGDIINPATWAITKTLSGAARSLWYGTNQDTIVTESWGTLPGSELSMPIAMFRILMAMFANPPDPVATGYIQWYPNYINNRKYYVVLADITCGSTPKPQLAKLYGISSVNAVFDDIINAKNPDGTNNGWMTKPVTLYLNVVDQF